MTDISKWSQSTRDWNLVPKASEFPFYKEQKKLPSDTESELYHHYEKYFKNKSKLQKPKNEQQYKYEQELSLEFKSQNNSMGQRRVKKDKFLANNYGCNKLNDSISSFNDQCQHKKPQIPKQSQQKEINNINNQQNQKKNFIQYNKFGPTFNNNLTLKQKQKILNQNYENEKKEKLENDQKQNYGKIPNYLIERQKKEQIQYYQTQQETIRPYSDLLVKWHKDQKAIEQRKQELKNKYNELNRNYQIKFGIKTQVYNDVLKEQKEQMEKEFKRLEKEIKFINQVEKQIETAKKNQNIDINIHDLQHNQKLKNKQINQNKSNLIHFAPCKK
ncbi:hypothetical protein PPERSA_08760 [Pseudocohnilembus persalinus]|uniref:Enkurin domain-containing protein n=1 Tax=Pseudocohnilembus persalinus TaxID=266149 RepID=A0A0V0R810_PSEPJ|nr:hypothetical protein PPERSA_08760 [Pseudocohnilembus persalinus]|eukprot:KRX10458.1 hypothetical protein PPERSA_08760 [Pseudocohnilembus persalinus]